MKNNEVKFWLLLLLLNALLFLPGYLVNYHTSSFFPYQGFLHGSIYERFKSIFVRQNYDIFRVSVDLFVLVFTFYFLRNRLKPGLYGWFAGIYFVVIFSFQSYYVLLEKLYRTPPILFNDLSLLKLGIYNSGGDSVFKFVIGVILSLVVVSVLIWFVKRLIWYTYALKIGTYSKIFLLLLASLFLVNTLKSGITCEEDQTFQESIALLSINIKNSADASRNLHNFDVDKLNKLLDFSDFSLRKKPNIYLIFIESYGKTLYENPALRGTYFNCVERCESVLLKGGWNSVSGFSTSPVSGGQSWISYTSVLFGYNIRNEGTYHTLLKNPSMARYNNLFRILKNNGYTTFRLNAMPQNAKIEIPWDIYSNFYSIDHWINFRDMHYNGLLYGFGPSPPDQYSINFAKSYIEKKSNGPFALFFITQTTHHPYISPDSLSSQWQNLSVKHDTKQETHSSVFLRRPDLKNYLKAVCYDINTLSQFISSQDDSTSIFILIGDHQPPVLTGKNEGFETPVHIISKNREFTDGFLAYGFNQGMKAGRNSKPIHHEGIYSMFMHEFCRIYGYPTDHLPVYMPEGLSKGQP